MMPIADNAEHSDPAALSDGGEEACGQCCEERCAKSCGCERCCSRCRRCCRCLCCRRCCSRRSCGCCYGADTPGPLPVDVTWEYALKYVVDDNVALGCVLQFRAWPPFLERLLMLLLFLATAVFVEYAQQAIGPICIREYLDQCPAYSAPAKHNTVPVQYITLAPPSILLPEGTGRAGASRSAGNVTSRGDGMAGEDGEAGTVATSSGALGKAAALRSSALARLSIMFGSPRFDCRKPMCDIFYPQMIDWLSLWRLTNSIWGTSTSHSNPFTSEAVLVGYCKCEGPVYDGIASARVSGGARSLAVTLLFQTLLPKLFEAAFSFTRSGSAREVSERSCCRIPRSRCHKLTVAALLATALMLCLGVFLLKFDPAGWRNAFLASAINAAVLSPLTSLLQFLLCVRIGCTKPTEELLEQPWLCSKVGVIAAQQLDVEREVGPARIGQPLTQDAQDA